MTEEYTSTKSAVLDTESEPRPGQWVNRNRRNLTPPFKRRVLVYDGIEGDLKVQLKEEVENRKSPNHCVDVF